MSKQRSTQQEVLNDHLVTGLKGSVEDDLAHEGVRKMAALLQSQLPKCTFACKLRLVSGEIGMLQWTGHSPAGSVRDGVDSYVVRDGRIAAQTIYYTLAPGEE